MKSWSVRLRAIPGGRWAGPGRVPVPGIPFPAPQGWTRRADDSQDAVAACGPSPSSVALASVTPVRCVGSRVPGGPLPCLPLGTLRPSTPATPSASSWDAATRAVKPMRAFTQATSLPPAPSSHQVNLGRHCSDHSANEACHIPQCHPWVWGPCHLSSIISIPDLVVQRS